MSSPAGPQSPLSAFAPTTEFTILNYPICEPNMNRIMKNKPSSFVSGFFLLTICEVHPCCPMWL